MCQVHLRMDLEMFTLFGKVMLDAEGEEKAQGFANFKSPWNDSSHTFVWDDGFPKGTGSSTTN